MRRMLSGSGTPLRLRPSAALRLVGAATGSTLAVALAALLYAVDPFFAAPPLIGVPLGALLGFIAAPILVVGTLEQANARAALLAVVAILCGLVGFAAYDGWRTGWDWFPTALIAYSVAATMFGLLPALLVSIAAAHLLRRLAPYADEIWKPAVVALVICFGIAAAMLPAVIDAIAVGD